MKLKQYAEQGLPVNHIPVIDVHAHIGPVPGNYMPYGYAEELQLQHLLENMQQAGIDYTVVSMLRGLFTNQLEANLDLARWMESYRQILGWVTYIPSMQQASLKIAEQCFAQSDRFVGIKIHPEVNRHPMDGLGYSAMWEYANANHLLVLVHTWGGCPYSDPTRLWSVMKRYPNITLLIGHSGGEEPGTEWHRPFTN